MLGFLNQKPWFEDFSDRSVVFTRWTHDEDPTNSYPVVIIYDPEAAERARTRDLKMVGVITAEFAPDAIVSDRMPDGPLVMKLRRTLDDALESACSQAKLKANLFATQTGGDTRQYFLLLDSVEKLRAAVSTLPVPAGIVLQVWERGNLPELLSWFKPSRLEAWSVRDDEVRAVFAERGDDGVLPRDARFFFYGGDQTALAEAAMRSGFTVETSGEPILVSKDMPITADELNALNRVFSDWVDAFGVTYDGWEAAMLVKN
jgi:hypothetical protein